jgi:outer membrane protein TolC
MNNGSLSNPVERPAAISMIFLLLIGMAVLPLKVCSQTSLDSLLSRVERNSPGIKGAEQYLTNVQLRSGTNRFPEDPELEYAYLWGSPDNLGNRTDFSISQSFEFPVVYTTRSKRSETSVRKASSIVKNVRQENLLKAKKIWVENVYLNRMGKMLRERLSNARVAERHLCLQLENGEISRLQYNKILLLLSDLHAEMDLLEAETMSLDAEIRKLTGGRTTNIVDSIYPSTNPALLDSVLAASMKDPLYRAHLEEVELQDLERKLARALSWPKFKTGYYSEKVLGTQFQGIQIGLTIPIWENANKVRTASGEVISAQLAADKYRAEKTAELSGLHSRYLGYQKQMAQLSDALESSNDPEIMAAALEAGEVSMVEYFYETDLYYRVRAKLLLAEKEFYLAEAELRIYEL